MDLPNPIPATFDVLKSVASERELFDILSRKLHDLMKFLEFATEDLTWSRQHPVFMTKTLDWITQRYYAQKFPMELAIKVAHQLRKHFHVLESFIPKDLTVCLQGHECPLNSLLFTVNSEPLQRLVRRECRDKNTTVLELENVSASAFENLLEYMLHGEIASISGKRESILYETLELASSWEMKEPTEWCQEALEKYISNDNKISLLRKCLDKQWLILLGHCIRWINQTNHGIQLEFLSSKAIHIEFRNFRDPAMKLFDSLQELLTGLSVHGDLTEQARFTELLQRWPALKSLDLSGTTSFSDRLLDIPSSLVELDLSSCDWLNSKTLKMLIGLCPNVSKLSLAGNILLDHNSWVLLKEFPKLEILNLAFCEQIGDAEFGLILQACRNVTTFLLNQCRGLSNQAFFELGKMIPELQELDASRTHLTDSGLLDLQEHCPFLSVLKLVRCTDLSEKAIKECALRSRNLRRLDVTGCEIGKGSLQEIAKIKPSLELII